ncbi:Retrovirus-related Pol polyprotein from transposon TNT 1-94 [Gossypium australe]|uniref:Retrovirus-related Pol polyprotein from transposon TNT 1-94 n=1 Tax=Gossypium australe TaxID=47621 RepID=A0A5B6WI02_9ROSI|nr:Retrovirus-related Pol polyprotein from transposon TNT 1-94 [Gossypium australe]
MTLEEAWSRRRLTVDYFKIFGDQSKAYKLYNLVSKNIIISRYVVFDEENFWPWNDSDTVVTPIPIEFEEDQ